MKTIKENLIICSIGIVLFSIMLVTTSCSSIDTLLKRKIRSELGSLIYEAEEIPISSEGDMADEIQRQWNVYVPDYDLTYQVWLSTSSDDIWGVVEYKMSSNFSTVFLNYFFDKYQGEKMYLSFEKLSDSPRAAGEFSLLYWDEESLEACLAEMKAFCEYVDSECDFQFATSWEFSRRCELETINNDIYRGDFRVLNSLSGISRGHMKEYYEFMEEYIGIWDMALLLRLYADVEEFYPGKSTAEIVRLVGGKRILMDTDGRTYPDIHGFYFAELYKLPAYFNINVKGDRTDFSFDKDGKHYEFSYRFFDPDGEPRFYFLEDGKKIGTDTDSFTCPSYYVESIFGRNFYWSNVKSH